MYTCTVHVEACRGMYITFICVYISLSVSVCVCVCVCVIITPQNADPVKRQRGVHVEREHPWEALFNFLIVLQQPIQQFIQWCISDVSLCVCV